MEPKAKTTRASLKRLTKVQLIDMVIGHGRAIDQLKAQIEVNVATLEDVQRRLKARRDMHEQAEREINGWKESNDKLCETINHLRRQLDAAVKEREEEREYRCRVASAFACEEEKSAELAVDLEHANGKIALLEDLIVKIVHGKGCSHD